MQRDIQRVNSRAERERDLRLLTAVSIVRVTQQWAQRVRFFNLNSRWRLMSQEGLGLSARYRVKSVN